MIRHKILDVWVKEDNPASQTVVFLKYIKHNKNKFPLTSTL